MNQERYDKKTRALAKIFSIEIIAAAQKVFD
jgi:hypothetical protein